VRYVLKEAAFAKGLALGQFGEELRALFGLSLSVSLMNGEVTVSVDEAIDEKALDTAVLDHLPVAVVDPLSALRAKRALDQELTLTDLQKIADVVLSR
jgi:hypothetical protein